MMTWLITRGSQILVCGFSAAVLIAAIRTAIKEGL